jgi:hypothetical protein
MEWHRHFGLLLMDFFTGSPYAVDIERDLSVQQQRLDVIILRKRKGRFTERLPDGLNDLADYNLITFKSYRQALDGWALKELVGHYVAYRKLVSPSPDALLPEGQFQLYAVCSRFPHNLAAVVELGPVAPGVYHCRWGTDLIRVVVVRQLPEAEHNAPLFLFSGSAEQVAYGAQHYRQRSENTSTLLYDLLQGYQGEGVVMPYTMEDFRHDFVKRHFKDLTPEERQEALQALPPEQRLAALQSLLAAERLEGLSLTEIESHLKQRREETGSSPEKTESRRKRRKPPNR